MVGVWRLRGGSSNSDSNLLVVHGAELRVPLSSNHVLLPICDEYHSESSTVTQLEFLELETRKVRKLVERSNLFEELYDYEFQRRFQLTKESVAELTLLIEDKLESKTPCNNAQNPVEQVLIALRFYAVAYMQLAFADMFNVSQPTVCRVVHQVSEAIASLLPDFLHLPVNLE
ncbi:nuclease HARBI1 [Trichonephila clavipes]|nr:nuclease HARBI1 [Trichonephila clavipes]